MAAAAEQFQEQADSRQRYARSWLRLLKQARRALPGGRTAP